MSKDPRMDTILRVIQFVENNLRSPISVKDMATEAGYSPYYFCTLFSQFTNHSPYDYLIRRRMTQAGKQLVNTDFRVVDVAYEFQFESHEGFTRAFGRIFGKPPNTIKQNQCLPYLACLEPLTDGHLQSLDGLRTLNPVAQRIETQSPLIGKPIEVQTCWPEPNKINISAQSPATHILRLELEEPENVIHLFDWVLHTWLFFSPYQLFNSVLYQSGEVSFQIPILLK